MAFSSYSPTPVYPSPFFIFYLFRCFLHNIVFCDYKYFWPNLFFKTISYFALNLCFYYTFLFTLAYCFLLFTFTFYRLLSTFCFLIFLISLLLIRIWFLSFTHKFLFPLSQSQSVFHSLIPRRILIAVYTALYSLSQNYFTEKLKRLI